MADEQWLTAATIDDAVVAELLVRLKQVKQPQPPPPPPAAALLPGPSSKPALSLEWRVRQRRSRAVVVNQEKKQAAPRASPTTPLSWSGATSVSGGSFDGGPDEISGRPSPLPAPQKHSDVSRSKAIEASEATPNKKPRRKKTLAELKGEEDFLEKERRKLKRELETLRLNLEKERARNENYKRMKLELSAVEPRSSPANSSTEKNKEISKFVLPDLNIPFEEDCSCDVLREVSLARSSYGR